MLQMTEFCTDLKDPYLEENPNRTIQHKRYCLWLGNSLGQTHFGGWWNILGKHIDVFFPESLLLPITYLTVCNLNWFACSSPWRFSRRIFDIEKPKMLGNCLLERFSCPIESIDADYRLSASCKGKEVTWTVPRRAFRSRNCLSFPLCSSTEYCLLIPRLCEC